MRRFLKIGTAALALLVLLVLAAVLLLVAPGPVQSIRTALLRMGISAVSGTLNGSLEVGGLQGSLLSNPILHDIVVRDAEGTVVVQLDELRLSYSLTPLLRKRLMIHEITLVRPQLTVSQDEEGNLNLSQLAPPSSPETKPEPESASTGLPLEIELTALQIRDGHLNLQLAALPGVRTVDDLQVKLGGLITQHTMQVDIQQFQAKTQPAKVDLHNLSGIVKKMGPDIRIDELRVETDSTHITVNGGLPSASQPANLIATVEPFDLTEIGRLLGDDTLNGQLHLKLTAEGPPEDIQLTTQLRAESGTLDLTGQLDIASSQPRYQGKLNLSQLDLAALGQREALKSDLNLQADLNGSGTSLDDLQAALRLDILSSKFGDITLNPSQVHVTMAEKRVQVQQFDLDTSVAQMTISGVLDLAGQSDLAYNLQANLDDLKSLVETTALNGSLKLQGTAQGEWPALTAQGTLDGTNLRYQTNQLQSVALTYEASQLGAQPLATAALHLQAAQLGTFPVDRVTLNATYDGSVRQLKMDMQVQQSPAYDGSLSGAVNLTDTGQDIRLDTVTIQLDEHLWQAPAPISVAIQGSDVQIQTFRLEHDAESIELSGGIVSDQFRELKLNATQIDLDFLRRLLPLPELMGGRATLGTHLAGTLRKPQLQTNLEILNSAESAGPFERLYLTLNYAQQQLKSTFFLRQNAKDTIALNLDVPIDMALTSLPLAQRLQSKPISIRLDITQPDLAAIGQGLPNPLDLSGTVEGAINFQGTYAKLRLDSDLTLQKVGRAGTIENLNGPLNLTGTLITGDSVPAVGAALNEGKLTATVRDLTLSSSQIEGTLPGQAEPNNQVRLHDLLFQADGQWNPNGLNATIQALQLRAKALDLPPIDLAVAGRMTPAQIELSKLQINMPKSEISGNGHLTLPNQDIDFKIELPHLQLDEMIPTLTETLPKEVTGTVTLAGRVPEPQAAIDLQYAGATINADVSANLEKPIPEYAADLRISNLDASQFNPKMTGRLTTKASLNGKGFTKQDRQAKLSVDVSSDAFSLAPHLAAIIRANVRGTAATLDTLNVQSEPIDLTAKGSLSADQTAAFDYELTLDDFTPIREQLGLDVDAKGTLTGTLNGPLDALQTQANLKLEQWKYATFQGEAVALDMSGSGLPATPQVTISTRLASIQGPSLPASDLSLDGIYRSDQGDFNLTVTDGPFNQTQVAGTANLKTGQQVILDTLRLKRGDWAWANPEPIKITRSATGQLEIPNFVLRSGDEELFVQARLSPNGAIGGEVNIKQLQIQRNIQAVAPDVAPADGVVTVDMKLGGTLERPSANGTAQLKSLKWQDNRLGDITANIDLANNILKSDIRWLDQQTELLRANGTVGLDPAGQLDMQVTASDVDLNRFKSYTEQVMQSAGVLNLNLNLSGTLKQPVINGEMTLNDGSLQLAATGEPYNDIQAQLNFAGERLTIDQLQVGSSTGQLQLNGWVQTAKLALKELDIKVDAQDFTVMNTPDIQARFTSDLSARGSLEDLAVDGTVTIPRARVRVEGLLGGGPAAVKPEELTVEGVYGPGVEGPDTPDGQTETEKPKDPIPFLRADVKVKMPKNVWVQARGTAIELRGDLDVKKKLESPLTVAGDVETVRGFATFFGKKFTLENGRVTFTGAEQINPTLDVTATHKVAGYIVTIQVEGPSTKPKLNLSSSPEELEQADIMSLLMFGRTSDRLSASEETSLSNRAQSAAAGVAAGAAAQAVGKELGLDTVEVEVGDDPSKARLGAGRYITQDIFLSYERQLGRDGGNTIGVEYSLSRRLMLKGTQSDIGESSVDFLWRIDY